MQSDNACACFVRVGRCRFGSILGSHFGVILGAKFATILLLGRPGGPNRLTKERLKKSKQKITKTDLTRRYEELQLTDPGALETVKLSDNQTVQMSLQYWAPETLHFVLKARWRIFYSLRGTWRPYGLAEGFVFEGWNA